MKFRLDAVLFCVVIFILTVVAFILVRVGTLIIVFLSMLAYLVIPFYVYDFLVGPLMDKLSRRKILLLTFSVMGIAVVFTQSVWVIVTPKWSFSVTTDKSTYELGENVQITVSLENLGFIPHSFTSSISGPIVVSVSLYESQVWYSPFHWNKTEFIIHPNQSLKRTFTWNQSNIHFPEEKIKPGTYLIEAFIPSANWKGGRSQLLLHAWKCINITAT